MKLLLDTHLLLWAVGSGGDGPLRSLPVEALALLEAADEVYFSVASVWEIAISRVPPRESSGLIRTCSGGS